MKVVDLIEMLEHFDGEERVIIEIDGKKADISGVDGIREVKKDDKAGIITSHEFVIIH